MTENAADPATDAPLPVNGVLQRVLDFVGALRRAGVGPSQSETIDAFRAVAELDLLDREQLREGLAAVTLTSPSQRRTFDALYEVYFPARPVSLSGSAPGTVDRASFATPEAYLDELLESLLDGEPERLRDLAREAVEAFGGAERPDGGISYYQYKVLRTVDLGRLLGDMLTGTGGADGDRSTLEERLLRDEFQARLRTVRDEIETEVRRRTSGDRGLDQLADRSVMPSVEDRDFVRLRVEDQAQLRAQIQPLARKLASRAAVKRRRGRDGRLDVRRTVRRSLASGGIPFDPVFATQRPHRPELVVICDVSGSVASFARFTLLLVHALQEQFSKVRSFAFIDTVDEVTALFEQADATRAISRMMLEADLVVGDGRSDYGRALERFHTEYAHAVSPRATVLVLGDARNNFRQANAWVVQDLRERVRRVYWLNPEPLPFWDTGDSIASTYGRFVDEMVEARNLRHLARFIERIT